MIADKLRRIQPSGEGSEPRYFPCSVTLKSGANVECVYLCEAISWFALWGVWPEDARGKRSINVEDIADLQESVFRLPARFANRIYRAGESGMGYTIFVVEFGDGTHAAYGTGNAVDFITYPPGQSAATVKHLSRRGRRSRPAETRDEASGAGSRQRTLNDLWRGLWRLRPPCVAEALAKADGRPLPPVDNLGVPLYLFITR
jgi:hypothetical protein